jgi:hypothetical protein
MAIAQSAGAWLEDYARQCTSRMRPPVAALIVLSWI